MVFARASPLREEQAQSGEGVLQDGSPPSQPHLTLSTSKYHGAELGLQSKIWGHKCSAMTARIQGQKSRCGFPTMRGEGANT